MHTNLYFVGTAGCGKSTLTSEFKKWMDMNGFQAVTINLDPGAEQLPYDPEIDIREWISLEGVMDEHGLGPNGAQIVCADMIALNATQIRDVMDTYECDYFLIDTPGQIELFTFRRSSTELMKILGDEYSTIAFLFDPILSKQPSGFISLMLLAITTQFRFNVPYIPILSKSDILSDVDLELILQRASDLTLLESDLRDNENRDNFVGIELVKSLEQIIDQQTLIPVSSLEPKGLEDIYTEVQSAFYGCDDLESY